MFFSYSSSSQTIPIFLPIKIYILFSFFTNKQTKTNNCTLPQNENINKTNEIFKEMPQTK